MMEWMKWMKEWNPLDQYKALLNLKIIQKILIYFMISHLHIQFLLLKCLKLMEFKMILLI